MKELKAGLNAAMLEHRPGSISKGVGTRVNVKLTELRLRNLLYQGAGVSPDGAGCPWCPAEESTSSIAPLLVSQSCLAPLPCGFLGREERSGSRRGA